MNNDKPMGWEEELQYEIMEDYLGCIERDALYKSRDPRAHMEEMRGHFEKLKSFISRIEASAYQKGKEDGIAEEAIGCYEHSEKAYQKGKDDAVGYIRGYLEGGGLMEARCYEYSVKEVLEAAANQPMV